MTRYLTTALALLAIAACHGDRGVDSIPVDSMASALGDTQRVAIRGREALVENSGAAMSTTQPGIWFTINDSGNDPLIFALDSLGADRGAWRVRGVRNRDWEAITEGPCVGDDGQVRRDARCVYIGEVGDNDAKHPTVAVYRVPEPAALASGATATVRARQLEFTYEGGARDVEAMYMSRDGTLHFISKRPLLGPGGVMRPALVFSLPPAAWARKGVQRAALADSLTIVPTTGPRQVTDAALSPDGSRLAVRTYSELYLYAVDPLTGRVGAAGPLALCDLTPLAEPQGEGVAWLGDRVMLTSERRESPFWLVRCG